MIVAPLAGSVDRNKEVDSGLFKLSVAPLAGSVDRNKTPVTLQAVASVAPLAGSVDRNRERDVLHFRLFQRRSPRGERG